MEKFFVDFKLEKVDTRPFILNILFLNTLQIYKYELKEKSSHSFYSLCLLNVNSFKLKDVDE